MGYVRQVDSSSADVRRKPQPFTRFVGVNVGVSAVSSAHKANEINELRGKFYGFPLRQCLCGSQNRSAAGAPASRGLAPLKCGNSVQAQGIAKRPGLVLSRR